MFEKKTKMECLYKV